MANLALSQLGQVQVPATPAMQKEVIACMETEAGFKLLQRQAQMYTTSQMVPKQYQGAENLANCVIALDMANRMKMAPLMVMQNLYIVYGTPSWSSKFLIATFNQCGRFTNINYKMFGEKDTDSWGCIAYAKDKESGETIYSPEITIGLAKKEGWYDRKDKTSGAFISKWRTMPELMLRYRAASYLIKTYAPEISMGLSTEDEVFDMQEDAKGSYIVAEVANAYVPPAKPVEAVSEGKELPSAAEVKADVFEGTASEMPAAAAAEKPKRERSKKEVPAVVQNTAEIPVEAEEKSPFRQKLDSMSPEERAAEEAKITAENERRREAKVIQSNFEDDDAFYTNGR